MEARSGAASERARPRWLAARSAVVVVGLVALGVASGCRRARSSAGSDGADAAGRSAASADPIPYAEVRRAPFAPPARFAAALPQTVETFGALAQGDPNYPPSSYVQDLLCAGDRGMLARWIEAARNAAAAGAPAGRLWETYGMMLAFCGDAPAMCAFVERVVAGSEPAAVREAAWRGIDACRGDAARRLLNRSDAPARVLVLPLSAPSLLTDDGPSEFSPRLEKAVREVVRTAQPHEARWAASRLGVLDDPRAALALRRLYAEATNPERRRDIALAMGRQSDPGARAIFAAACRERSDMACRRDEPSQRHSSFDLRGDLAELVREERVDLGALAARNADRRDALVAALASCASSADDTLRRYPCLGQLARIDRARSVAVARNAPAASGDFLLAELVAALVRYPAPGALAERLRSLGLIERVAAAGDGGDGAPLTARDLMIEAGRAHLFDVETDQFPSEHDSLLRALARLAGGSLAGVLFEEVAPPEGESDDHPPYRLHAYVERLRLTVTANDLGDGYDVEAVVGLLNVLLRDRRGELRFAIAGSDGQMATVLVGPETALRAIAAEGLVQLAGASGAMDTGRQTEERAAHKLSR